MARIWGILRRGDRIAKEHIVQFEEEFPPFAEVVEQLCEQLDIPRPVVLGKHEREWAQFLRTHFDSADFVESVSFRRFELEYLKERKKHPHEKRLSY